MYGGPALSVPSLALAQHQLGHTLTIIVPHSPANLAHASSLLGGKVASNGISLKFINSGIPSFFPKAKAHSTSLKAALLGFDIVAIHDMWHPFLARAALCAQSLQIPYCLSPRGALNEWSLSQKRTKKVVALAILWRRLIQKAAFLHALNAGERDQLAALNLNDSLIVAPNGVFSEEDTESSEISTLLGRFISKSVRRYVIFLSRLHHKKGLDILIPAFKKVSSRIKDVGLVIAGPDEGSEAYTRKLVTELRLNELVHFPGPLFGRNKYAALSGACLFCLPSRDEGFSMAIIEAMSAGLPVLISDRCNFPEVEVTNSGSIVPLDMDALADQMIKMLSDPKALIEIGNNAKRTVHLNYTWQRVAQKLTGEYSKLLGH